MSLASTRSRRANAGSRLKQLIELEEQQQRQTLPQTFIGDDDDENVRLLFQEEGEDGEFIDEDVDNENLKGIDEEEEEEKEENDDEEKSKVDDDDVLSESDLSDSDSDEEEGEKELERQQKKKKRKSVIPAIREPIAPKRSKTTILASADSLTSEDRRVSSRKSALEKKSALIAKLQEDEERARANKQVFVPVEYIEPTQEERLAQAVETERLNVLALEEFRQQEIVKKENQRHLLARRRTLANVLRFSSRVEFVGPKEELLRLRRKLEKERNRKKGGRKKKIPDSIEVLKKKMWLPGDVDEDLPYVKEELERKKRERGEIKEEEKEEKKKEEEEGEKEKEKEREKVKEKEKVKRGNKKVKEEEEENEKDKDSDEESDDAQEKSPKYNMDLLFDPDLPRFDADDVFEGPVQKVTRDSIFLLEFEGFLDRTTVRKVVLGEQSILGSSRRFKDLKPEIRIGQRGYSAIPAPEQPDPIFDPADELTEHDKIFEELRRLPHLGSQQIEDDYSDDEDDQKEMPIVIATEAPTSLYLHNNNKKACLISGKEVRYFDPNTGIPYDSVETYKILKDIEGGMVPWYSLSEDLDELGPVELYFGNREGMRHARGVPEGF